MLSQILLQTKSFEIGNITELGIIGFSIVLFALSITAYRNTGMKRIAFAAIAFALFAIQLFFDYAEEYFNFLDEDVADGVLSLVTLSILVLFFVAIVKRK